MIAFANVGASGGRPGSPTPVGATVLDTTRYGGKTRPQIAEHMGHDSLVGWAWNPGAERTPAPGTQEQFGKLIEA